MSNSSPDIDRTVGRPSSDPLATEFFEGSVDPDVSGASAFSSGFVLAGKFRLEKQLGRGGMGEAWKAFDTLAERPVVLKFVPKEIQHVKEAMDSVKDSFKKVHALQHQHICPVYDLIQDEHHGLCLVMKFIDGMPLDEYRRKLVEKSKNLSFSDLVQILWGAAQGLDYAHEKKVVHRDIKPQNIMIGKSDGVQIIDFGLAEEIRTSMVKFSEVQMNVAGTRPYMAPEQWQGKYQDAATDQYALAVTAYELFSGRVPFQGNDVAILRECVLHDAPDPIPNLPEYVNAALLKALSKKREDRFGSCKAFIRALTTKPKKAAETEESIEVVPENAAAVSSLPTIYLKSDGRNQDATVWKPQISTGSIKKPVVKPERRSFVPLYTAIGVVAALLILGAIVALSSRSERRETVVNKPTSRQNAGTKPVDKKAAETSPTKTQRDLPVLSGDEKTSPSPETASVEELPYHEFEVKMLDRLWAKYNVAVQYNLDKQLKGANWPNEKPNKFDRLTGVMFWTPNRQPRYAVAERNDLFPCVIPGFVHTEKTNARCSCKLSVDDYQQLNRLKLDYLNLGGLQLTLPGLETLFEGSSVKQLDMTAVPKLPHWEPLKKLRSLEKLNVHSNDLEAVHLEVIGSLPRLSSVNLGDCRFPPGTLRPLANNTTLTEILLHDCACLVSDDFKTLATLPSLQKLGLSLAVLTDADLLQIAAVPKLNNLILKNNGITAQGLAAFRRKRPDVNVDLGDQTAFPVYFSDIPAETTEMFVGDVVWESVETRFGGPGPQSLNTRQNVYKKSLFAPAPSRLVYRPAKQWKTFESNIALLLPFTYRWHSMHNYLHMDGDLSLSARFVVKGDGKELYRSEIIRDSNEKSVSVDISNVDVLELIVDDCGDGAKYDCAVWFDPKLKRDVVSSKAVPKSTPAPSGLSDAEKKELQQKYPEIDWKDANIIVLPTLTLDDLNQTLYLTSETTANDIVVVRTTKENHRFVLRGGPLTIDLNAEKKGSVAFLALGPEKLILDGNKKDRILLIKNGAKADFAGIVFTNGFVVDDRGGAIVVCDNSQAGFFDCEFIDNACVPREKRIWWDKFGGGAVASWKNSSLILRNTLFEGNRNNLPEAFANEKKEGLRVCTDSSASLLMDDDSSLVAMNVVFRNNLGGAMFLQYMKSFEMTNISLIDNKSRGGGTVHVNGKNNDRTYRITNLFASGNSSGEFGGALHVGGKGRYLLDHLTLVDNFGTHGGGLCIGGGGDYGLSAEEIVLSNSLIAGNRAEHAKDFSRHENNEKKSVQKYNFCNNITSENNSYQNTPFMQGKNNRMMNLHDLKLGPINDFGNGIPVMPLLPGSPAIDAGAVTEATPKTDITGRPRVVGKAPDIGAFEVQ